MKPRYCIGALGIAIAAATGSLAGAESTATITQSDGTSVIRRVFRSPDSQTIVQQHGGNRAIVTQGWSGGKARYERALNKGGSDMLVRIAPEDRKELQELARDEGTTVQALVEEAIQDFLDRNR